MGLSAEVIAEATTWWNTRAPESGWRPIKTAPKFTPVMITNGKYLVKAELIDVDWDEAKNRGCFGWVGIGVFVEVVDDPTHWMPEMPLPSPPESEASNG
jgi:hypothetical protein